MIPRTRVRGAIVQLHTLLISKQLHKRLQGTAITLGKWVYAQLLGKRYRSQLTRPFINITKLVFMNGSKCFQAKTIFGKRNLAT
eukprot:gene39266-48508_t